MTELKELLRKEIYATGAVAIGFSKAETVESGVEKEFSTWIEKGWHAGMDYLVRHSSLRTHPRNVLEDAATVISIAYSYAPAIRDDGPNPVIAAYAYGDDYHDVLRNSLAPVTERIKDTYGGHWRICIDSAPLAERYWALRSGLGRKGLNGSVIIDGYGSYIFLAEILTSLQIPSDSPTVGVCSRCGECVRACPTSALHSDGTIDCRRCLNYLTIEHRGEWDATGIEAMRTEAGRHTLYGCDICLKVCPHNREIPSSAIAEFQPRPEILNCSKESVLSLTQPEFSALFKGSPIKRAKLAGLQRNAHNLDDPLNIIISSGLL